MRVLLVSPARAAAHLVAAQLVEHLSDRHTFGVVAAAGAADTGARARLTARTTTVDVVPAVHPSSGSGGPVLRALAGAVRRTSRSFRPDLVHLESGLMLPLAAVVDAPCVLACHEAPPAPGRDELDRVTACVVDSEHDRRRLASLLPFERIEVIRAAIDSERYAYRRIAHAARLVFTGDLGDPLDVEAARRLATSVLPAIRRRLARAELLVASRGTAEPARELTRLPGVRVEGRLGDLRPSVWSGSVYASPLEGGAGRAARILEALALGTPVVASAASLSRLDDVVAGHHVLAAESDADFADAVSLLLRQPIVANTLARNARALVERDHAWAAVARQYDALYQRLGRRRAEQAA
jgi:glycosyltransferase involved in cell wall biosynthesis